jgi:hypothetical protein
METVNCQLSLSCDLEGLMDTEDAELQYAGGMTGLRYNLQQAF